ncbi:bifunctional DNA-binding transcriptional regulator/O6-methylguanine-DNA methyltransferase Ada [Pseudoduganella umbonata]|uniref:methylated-DNA--[protein]-cysteine S-methyltransferase n=1 Tax=Pseudoduganella umbonata TaxID=864828 RepID=A0A4P8HQ82_9BURK|nr:bifunctional DNA-binding transcriptional regulator/O6-methylguanine-DNA methyltransferase Ada [Pseudoduganella umbonata]MBB3220565.1 AraC family transcriptional regulator of adaptative response/methylated-DNA-[protein]-cysteine methyltransferase [Pseudoduganella umbonata]QCP11927.1 bifunctional DNA-binding transcriptional regulator/O6-methylguanine-DNA methyltransferase Ada [Pseudoduganella umbonata]
MDHPTFDPAPASDNDEFSTDEFDTDEIRWAAVQRRDPAADGRFVYSVRTTGVYCRPTCGARPALRANVSFHAGTREAELAGFRPCLRCKPDGPPLAERHAALVAEACRLIDAAEEEPDLATLAAASGISRFHLHRVFKAQTGITPKAYAAARRKERVQEQLAGPAQQPSVTQAIYAAGYNSSGRFYATARESLGMTPTAFRRGGSGATIRFAIAQCSLGAILVASTGVGICAILMGDDPEALARDLQDRFPNAELMGAEPDYEAVVAQVIGLVEAPETGLDLPLDVRGTAFQQRVWQALRTIPAGRKVSYTELAAMVGAPKSVRAVAGACAANALAVAIPCHRVVRNDGALSGYRWGVERKQALLEREDRKEPLGQEPAREGAK